MQVNRPENPQVVADVEILRRNVGVERVFGICVPKISPAKSGCQCFGRKVTVVAHAMELATEKADLVLWSDRLHEVSLAALIWRGHCQQHFLGKDPGQCLDAIGN